MRKVLFVLALCLALVGLTIGAPAATGCGEKASVAPAHKYDDGTPEYRSTVTESYRRLQFKISIYGELPPEGSGIRLGIYQAQAACGEGATEKNMARMEEAVQIAKAYNVQLLAFPELYVPGYTLSPEEARQVAEFKDGPTITRAREVAGENNMALILPYAEKVEEQQGNPHY